MSRGSVVASATNAAVMLAISCTISSLPLSSEEAWMGDALLVLVNFNESGNGLQNLERHALKKVVTCAPCFVPSPRKVRRSNTPHFNFTQMVGMMTSPPALLFVTLLWSTTAPPSCAWRLPARVGLSQLTASTGRFWRQRALPLRVSPQDSAGDDGDKGELSRRTEDALIAAFSNATADMDANPYFDVVMKIAPNELIGQVKSGRFQPQVRCQGGH
eukprot:scaffold1913_cov257-Pinguiococcus_pyrenoidosus.AAC.23